MIALAQSSKYKTLAIVQKNELLDFLATCAPIAKGGLPPMVCFSANANGGLVLTVTTRLVFLQYRTGFATGDFLGFMVPFRVLRDHVKTCQGSLLFAWETGRLEITDDAGAKWSTPTLEMERHAEDYGKMIACATMSRARMLAALPTLLKLVQQDSPRNYGTGINFEVTDGNVFTMVGTDGFRLTYAELPREVDGTHANLHNAMLPDPCARVLLEALKTKSAQFLGLGVNDDSTTMRAEWSEKMVACFRLSAVKYPNWRGVLPKAKKLTRVTVDAKTFREKVSAAVKGSDKSHAIAMSGSASGILLRSRASKEAPENSYPFSLALGLDFATRYLNGRFVAEALEHVKGQVEISLTDDVEDPVGLYSEHVKTIVVPIRWNE